MIEFEGDKDYVELPPGHKIVKSATYLDGIAEMKAKYAPLVEAVRDVLDPAKISTYYKMGRVVDRLHKQWLEWWLQTGIHLPPRASAHAAWDASAARYAPLVEACQFMLSCIDVDIHTDDPELFLERTKEMEKALKAVADDV